MSIKKVNLLRLVGTSYLLFSSDLLLGLRRASPKLLSTPTVPR